jgi:hypothetical protein
MIADRKTFPWSTVFLVAGAAIVVFAIAWFSYRHFASRKSVTTNVSPPVAAEPQAVPATSEAAPLPVAAQPAGNTDAYDEDSAASEPAPVSSPATSKSSAARPRLSAKPH